MKKIHRRVKRHCPDTGETYFVRVRLPTKEFDRLALQRAGPKPGKPQRAQQHRARPVDAQQRPAPTPPLAYNDPRRAELRAQLTVRDGWRCRNCARAHGLTLDHIVPLCHGGGHHLANLQLLCGPCNQAKGAAVWAPEPVRPPAAPKFCPNCP